MEEHAPASSISKAFTLPFMPDRIQHDTGYQCRQESVSQRPVPSHDRTPVIHVQAHGTNVHRGYHENSIDIWGRGSYLGMIEVASGGDTIPVPAFAPSIRTQHAINRPMSNSHRHEVLPMSNSHRVAPAQSEESENSAGIGQGLGHPNTRGQPSPGVFRGRRMTYAQLIEKAILSTPNKEMPLCEIYDWLSRSDQMQSMDQVMFRGKTLSDTTFRLGHSLFVLFETINDLYGL